MTVFVVSSGLYATLDRDDTFHPQARERWGRLLTAGEPLMITNYILVESVALVQRRLGMEALQALVDDMVPVLQVEWITAEDHEQALSAVLSANRRDLSLVDCTSFHVMRRLGLKAAFAFDKHFRRQGFSTAPA